MRSLAALLIVLLAALIATGCASDEGSPNTASRPTAAGAAGGSSAPINTHCPVMPDHPIDPAVTVSYQGQSVGFCCDGCIAAWNGLSDAERSAKSMR